MKYLLANFKTNKNWSEVQNYFDQLDANFSKYNRSTTSHIIFYLNSLYSLVTSLKYPNFNIGNQSGSALGNGAFTSSVSFEQLKEDHINHVLIGHSEEYEYFKQSIPTINKKLIKALDLDLNVCLCFGNQNEIEDINQLVAELLKQLDELLINIPTNKLSNLILAYEPIYAIGSNNPMHSDLANAILGELKSKLKQKYNYEFTILYGGSVNITNISNYINNTNIDGALVGKECLDATKMQEMIKLVYGK